VGPPSKPATPRRPPFLPTETLYGQVPIAGPFNSAPRYKEKSPPEAPPAARDPCSGERRNERPLQITAVGRHGGGSRRLEWKLRRLALAISFDRSGISPLKWGQRSRGPSVVVPFSFVFEWKLFSGLPSWAHSALAPWPESHRGAGRRFGWFRLVLMDDRHVSWSTGVQQISGLEILLFQHGPLGSAACLATQANCRFVSRSSSLQTCPPASSLSVAIDGVRRLSPHRAWSGVSMVKVPAPRNHELARNIFISEHRSRRAVHKYPPAAVSVVPESVHLARPNNPRMRLQRNHIRRASLAHGTWPSIWKCCRKHRRSAPSTAGRDLFRHPALR